MGCFYPLPWKGTTDPKEEDASDIVIRDIEDVPSTGRRCAGSVTREFNDSAFIYGVRAEGIEGSAWPGSGSTVVSVGRTGGPCGGFTAGLAAFVDTDEGTDTLWASGASGATDLADFDNCNAPDATGACAEADACSGDYAVDIIPTSDSPAVACDEFESVRIEPQWTHHASEETSSAADCVAGSGRFDLVPFYAVNHDHDVLSGVWLAPLMLSGAGTMTNGARVSSATPVGATPATLRVARRGQDLRMGPDDALLSPDQTSVAVPPGETTTFGAEEVQGNPIFVLPDVSESGASGLQVDLAWTCPAPTGQLARPQGYQAKLVDMGCPWEQKVVVRPVFNAGPRRLELGLYGNQDFKKITKLTATDLFTATRGTLTVTGAWLGVENGEARIRLDSVTVGGAPVCTTGTFLLPPE